MMESPRVTGERLVWKTMEKEKLCVQQGNEAISRKLISRRGRFVEIYCPQLFRGNVTDSLERDELSKCGGFSKLPTAEAGSPQVMYDARCLVDVGRTSRIQ
jgi:hypothetical protein